MTKAPYPGTFSKGVSFIYIIWSVPSISLLLFTLLSTSSDHSDTVWRRSTLHVAKTSLLVH